MQIVKLSTKEIEGLTVYYPRNHTALLFAQMIKSSFISPHVLYFITQLGFTVEITPASIKQ